MPPAEIHDPHRPEISHKPRKRSNVCSRAAERIGYMALGVLLWYGWQIFRDFEGPMAAVGSIPHDHPMHRVVEASVFLTVAIVPLVTYFILRMRSQRRN
jgi:TRAP-type C4-dicarboxylate transport system permease small subunit